MSNFPPIPRLMQRLPRDERGYPIPIIVLRDAKGRPHFTVNNHHTVETCIAKRRCSLCGGPLGKTLWLIGGPLSAFAEGGAYLDPPVHEACGAFALQTCPYLAAPKYARRIDGCTLNPADLPQAVLLVDKTMIPQRPPVFVFGETRGFTLTNPSRYIRPKQPWRSLRFFLKGQEISAEEAEPLIDETFALQGIIRPRQTEAA